MKKITKIISPEHFIHNILPWFLQHSKIFVDYIEIGRRDTPPIFFGKFIIESLLQNKRELLDGPIWETKMMIPPIVNIGKAIMDEREFINSEYQILIHFYDCNYLCVWFKDEALAVEFLSRTGDGSVS